MGHTQSTAVLVEVSADGPLKIATNHDNDLGALFFDFRLYEHFCSICVAKGSDPVSHDSPPL